MKIETFSVWTPMSIVKSHNGGNEEQMVGRIGGIVSAETKDQQNETLEQSGVDWGYFLDKGWFNYEHGSGPENVLGHPERVSVTTHNGIPATRVEGVLYLAKPRAREIWDTAQAMSKANSSRKLGFSVEGQVIERDKSDKQKILKSRVLNVAITAHPVHPDARLEILAKSLVGYQTPTTITEGSLSPLLPQSIEPIPSLATYGAQAYRRKKMSTEELALMLTSTFPMLNYAQAMSVAVEIVRAVGK